MGNIQTQLQNASINGHITVKKAIEIGARADDQLNRSVDLLKKLKTQVGMTLGADISELVAEITKIKDKETVFYHDKEPDGQ